MKPTEEQAAIISARGNLRINAVAGSGKTTTILSYAKARPRGKRMLYLAFNRSVRKEAQQRFEKQGLKNVKVETAHSLAYKQIVFRHGYRVRPQGYKTHEIVELLGLRGSGEKHSELILANHIGKFASYFCNSRAKRVQDLQYLDTLSDPKTRSLVRSFYPLLERQTRRFLARMDRGTVEITHDFYLKKFQLSNPHLPYEYLLFDEGQDASPAMLEVFLQQPGVKVIVGDAHQQIYGWRHAINSLDQVDFRDYQLTRSFRFGPAIATLASGILDWKKQLGSADLPEIKGCGQSRGGQSRAILARTNLGLLLRAIDLVNEQNVRKLYFEGHINSYTYADEGASLYDILNLQQGHPHAIRDPLIRQMNGLEELEEYIEKTEDVQLGLMLEIVREYGKEIPGILREIKAKHVGKDEKEAAEVVLSTVHRSKGMEYDSVELVDDFINETRLRKALGESRDGQADLNRLREEINLLYVAVTRSKGKLRIPETLLPEGFEPSGEIEVLRKEEKEEENRPRRAANRPEKAYSVAKVRQTHRSAYRPWTQELDEELTELFCEGISVHGLARHFNRSKGAIRARIGKLELIETYGWPD